jgi:hypothetical protein
MTENDKKEIENISKEFAAEFKDTIGEIKGSGWLIVDPLSGYLKACGYEHSCGQVPANESHCLILILTFPDGTRFVPAGSDLPFDGATDWLWL